MPKYNASNFFNSNPKIYGKKYSIEEIEKRKNDLMEKMNMNLDIYHKEQYRKDHTLYMFNFINSKPEGSLLDMGGGSDIFPILAKLCFPKLEIGSSLFSVGSGVSLYSNSH